MKVILLAPTPPPAGGIASWTVRMMNARLKNGWTVDVVDEKVIGNRRVFGIHNRRNWFLEMKRSINIWSNLRKALRDPEVKIVHSCIPSVLLAMIREYVCACIVKRQGRKFIIHFRCTVPNIIQGRLAAFMLKKLCDKSDLILTLNQQTDCYIRKLTKTTTRLIPNFISADELADGHDIRDSIGTVVYVGGVIETKGAYDMMQVAGEFPDIQFRFVGERDAEAEEYAKKQKIANVVFTGPKNREEVS